MNRNHPIYNIKVSRAEFNAYFQSSDDWRSEMTVEKDYVSPSKPGYVVREIDGARQLGVMNWGIPPPFGVKPLVVNVRNYTSPFWRTALSNPDRRCLVFVTEFQEWSVEPDPVTAKKTKHWFAMPLRPIFAFAGIWRTVGDGAAYAFLTCGYDGDPAGHVVGAIHPKAMPVILHEEDFDRCCRHPYWTRYRLGARFLRSFYPSGRALLSEGAWKSAWPLSSGAVAKMHFRSGTSFRVQ